MLHSKIDFKVNFETSTIDATIVLTAKVKNEKARSLLLDTRNLNIKGVTSENGDELKYEMVGKNDEVFGQALSIPLNENVKRGDIFKYDSLSGYSGCEDDVGGFDSGSERSSSAHVCTWKWR